jgi:ribosomal-protein-alanine N-acetyltransferase
VAADQGRYLSMALLDWIGAEGGLRVEGEGVVLRPPRAADYLEWRDLRAASRAFLQPWEPTWPADDLTRAAFRRRLAAYARDRETGQAYSFFVFQQSDGALSGGITLSNIRRGVAQMGTVGYWCGQAFARRGLTLAAARALRRFAFDTLALHRLEAACLPHNDASRRLLVKAGFEEEGFAKAYLKINGVWRDHVLFGMTAPPRVGGVPDEFVSV